MHDDIGDELTGNRENIEQAVADLFADQFRRFAIFCRESLGMTPEEAEWLTVPTDNPNAYSRGYNDAMKSLEDAFELWMEGAGYT